MKKWKTSNETRGFDRMFTYAQKVQTRLIGMVDRFDSEECRQGDH